MAEALRCVSLALMAAVVIDGVVLTEACAVGLNTNPSALGCEHCVDKEQCIQRRGHARVSFWKPKNKIVDGKTFRFPAGW